MLLLLLFTLHIMQHIIYVQWFWRNLLYQLLGPDWSPSSEDQTTTAVDQRSWSNNRPAQLTVSCIQVNCQPPTYCTSY